MARRIVFHRFDDVLQEWVEAPLDSADTWTLSLANAVNGRELSEDQFERIVSLLDGRVQRGLTSQPSSGTL
jgi:hypothetical protein